MPWEQLLYAATILVLATPLSLGIRAILKGHLMTRQAYLDSVKILEDRLSDRDRQIAAIRAERDEWKSAFHAEAQTNSTVVRQLDVSIDTVRKFLGTTPMDGQGEGHGRNGQSDSRGRHPRGEGGQAER